MGISGFAGKEGSPSRCLRAAKCGRLARQKGDGKKGGLRAPSRHHANGLELRAHGRSSDFVSAVRRPSREKRGAEICKRARNAKSVRKKRGQSPQDRGTVPFFSKRSNPLPWWLPGGRVPTTPLVSSSPIGLFDLQQ